MTYPIEDLACPACASVGTVTDAAYEIDGFPVSSCVPAASREEALRVSRGAIELVGCHACGFVFNRAFDSRLVVYSDEYEDRQCFSPTFNRFQSELIGDLIDRFGLRGKRVMEIGCGKAVFLKELCKEGGNDGIGIDPVCPLQDEPGLSILREPFGLQHGSLAPDFICCRHTLEHIARPLAFLQTLRSAIGDRLQTGIFFEVPDTTRLLREHAFWDVQYEHCAYFSAGSLARLFRRCGFDVARISLLYGGQYLTIEAHPAARDASRADTSPQEEAPWETVAKLRRFGERVSTAIADWEALFKAGDYVRPVLWGGGAKCQGFMNAVAGATTVQYVVDVNPYLHGRFMVGSGARIVAPHFLREYRPDLLVVMNPVYETEIAASLAEMGISPELVSLR